ncbi:LptA/OstA family protein [Myxococcota bacterium]|nr:LptA/OstA family protein [Myxococcota bacterium]
MRVCAYTLTATLAVSFWLGWSAALAHAEEEDRTPFGIDVPNHDEPISIRADELEASSKEGARRLIFTSNVVVEQADIRIESQRLEAFYPKGSDQPERLLAEGQVVLVQNSLQAHCDHATYQRADRFLVCSGNAEVNDGGDWVRGETIEFDLEQEIVTVAGGASVLIHPGSEGPAALGELGAGEGARP